MHCADQANNPDDAEQPKNAQGAEVSSHVPFACYCDTLFSQLQAYHERVKDISDPTLHPEELSSVHKDAQCELGREYKAENSLTDNGKHKLLV